MIAIGTAVNNFYLGKTKLDSDTMEFICWTDEEINELKEEYSLKQEQICHKNQSSITYKVGTKYFTIHDIKPLPVFRYFETHLFMPSKGRRIAPPLLTYAWNKARATFINSDLNNWESYITTHSFLYNKFIKTAPKYYKTQLKTWANSLTFFGAMGHGANYSQYKFSTYDYYTEESLLNLFAYSDLGSIYNNISLSLPSGEKKLSKHLFDRLDHEKQLGLVMERLYTDCANEFILEELLYNEITGLSTEVLFKTSVMQRCSQSTYPWLTDFITENYIEIMEEFDPNFVDSLFNAIKFKTLENT